MKFFADTANISEINYCFSKGINDGITTNPKIIESTGNLSLGFEGACKEILQRYPSVPTSLETDLRGINVREIEKNSNLVKEILLEQSYELASWGKNVIIKIPICEGGLKAVEELSKKGIKTNVTACMTPYQIFKAADSGATYASLFANRMLDSKILELAGVNPDIILKNNGWKEVVSKNNNLLEDAWEKVLYQVAYVSKNLENSKTSLIVGSIRNPKDIGRLVAAQPQIITIPYKIAKELDEIQNLKSTVRSINSNSASVGFSLEHPMTTYSLEEFEKSASNYRKN